MSEDFAIFRVNPMDGPFPTGGQLTNYSDMPGYAIRPRPVPRDPCPNCGETSWGTADSDPQCCGACGTRICPLCDADFAEDYRPEPDNDRLSDNLGDHIAQWHTRTPQPPPS